MRLQQNGLAALMVTVEEEEHGNVAPREAVEEAGAIMDNRTILLLQDSSKTNNLPVPNAVLVEAITQPHNAIAAAFNATHMNMLGDSVPTGVLARTGAVERSVGKLWHSCCGILK